MVTINLLTMIFPNERAFIEPDPKSIIYDSRLFDEKDIKFIATADQTPRYVKLDFQPAKTQKENLQDALSHSGLTISESNLLESFDKEDFFMGSFQDISENVKIEDIIEKITIEGAASNYNFSGVEIIDTFADKKIYDMLNSSLTFHNIASSLDSPRERAMAFREAISQNDINIPNPTGLQKLSLIDILTDTQSSGITIAPNDVSEEVGNTASDPITKLF